MTDLSLDAPQLERLRDAILSAFPQPSELARLTRYRLDLKLAEIASGSLAEMASQLIEWAVSKGRLRALITEASAAAPDNPALCAFVDAIGMPDLTALGVPTGGRAGVVIDLSHGQSVWTPGSIFDLAESPTHGQRHHLRAVTDRRQLHADALKPWAGMLLGLPHHQRITEATRHEIVQWVRRGGRLALLGFELGERHHETNLNELADTFGLRFNTDIVGPKVWSPPAKPYREAVDFEGIRSSHPLLDGVARLRLWNLCTVAVEPGAEVLLRVGENSLWTLTKEGVRYDPNGWLRGGNQRFEGAAWGPWSPVIAEAPEGLTGRGAVVAIGTWEVFRHARSPFALPEGFDNGRFVANLFDWLARGAEI